METKISAGCLPLQFVNPRKGFDELVHVGPPCPLCWCIEWYLWEDGGSTCLDVVGSDPTSRADLNDLELDKHVAIPYHGSDHFEPHDFAVAPEPWLSGTICECAWCLTAFVWYEFEEEESG